MLLCSNYSYYVFTHIAFILFYSVPTAGKGAPENSAMEFEAKSGRDGAWLIFLSIHVYDILLLVFFPS